MKIVFKGKICADRGYMKCVIPHDFCNRNDINLKDDLLIRIKNNILHTYVSGTESSKMINIPIKLSKNLKKGQLLDIEIITKPKKNKKCIKIIKMGNNYFLDLYYSLPMNQIHVKNNLVVFELNNNQIFVSSKNVSNQVEFIRYLPLNEETFEIFGLYQGEGSKKHKRDCAQVGFINANAEIINLFLDYFNQILRIPREKWTCNIQYVGYEKSERKLVKYWNIKTGIPIENFRKTIFIDRRGNTSKEYGAFRIRITSSILTEIIMSILDNLRTLCFRNKLWTAAFLRGIMAADAHVKLTKWPNVTTLTMVELAIENNDEMELYDRLFDKLDITYHNYLEFGKIDIMHWDNLNKLAKIKALKLHPERYKTFIDGFNNHSKTTYELLP